MLLKWTELLRAEAGNRDTEMQRLLHLQVADSTLKKSKVLREQR